jgi:hypothetical protein
MLKAVLFHMVPPLPDCCVRHSAALRHYIVILGFTDNRATRFFRKLAMWNNLGAMAVPIAHATMSGLTPHAGHSGPIKRGGS